MNKEKKSNLKESVSRRDFLKNSAIAAGGVAAVSQLPFVMTAHAAPDTAINVALVGCGGRGSGAAGNVLEAGKLVNATQPNVKIVAVADVFPEKAEGAANRFKVSKETCFSGFDAYKQAISVPGVNYVILATPPGVRPAHLREAMNQGKHVFMEKPVATDGPGIRSVMASGKMADQKGLKIAAGTQRRHQAGYIETIQRIQDGAIGDVMYFRAYWNGGAIWHRGDAGSTPMEVQMRNWYHYLWICGDHIVEQHVHNLDVCNWIMGGHPVRAYGQGGRQGLGPNVSGSKWDHFAVEYEYANGVRMFSQCRQISGTQGNVSEAVHGTKGSSNPSGMIMPNSGSRWRFRGKAVNPYVQEHVDLINAIRTGGKLNEAQNVAESTMTAILGRESAYSGQGIEWDKAMEWKTSLVPEKLAWGPAPEAVIPIPGKWKMT